MSSQWHTWGQMKMRCAHMYVSVTPNLQAYNILATKSNRNKRAGDRKVESLATLENMSRTLFYSLIDSNAMVMSANSKQLGL